MRWALLASLLPSSPPSSCILGRTESWFGCLVYFFFFLFSGGKVFLDMVGMICASLFQDLDPGTPSFAFISEKLLFSYGGLGVTLVRGHRQLAQAGTLEVITCPYPI